MPVIETPVVGRVIAVNVSPGDRIARGDVVATVESMKMEIPIEAEHAGTVAQVMVAAGDDLAEGQAVARLD